MNHLEELLAASTSYSVFPKKTCWDNEALLKPYAKQIRHNVTIEGGLMTQSIHPCVSKSTFVFLISFLFWFPRKVRYCLVSSRKQHFKVREFNYLYFHVLFLKLP